MGETYSIWCADCGTHAPEIGDYGYIGTPSLAQRRGTFGYIYLGFEALNIFPAELEEFRIFLETHDGHEIRSSPDLSELDGGRGSRTSPPKSRRKRAKPRKIRYVQASYQVECRDCGARFVSVDFGPMRNFQSVPLSTERLKRFRGHVLGSDDAFYHVGHPLLDPSHNGELYDLDAFLKEHQRCRLWASLERGKSSSVPSAVERAKPVAERELPSSETATSFEIVEAPPELEPLLEATAGESLETMLEAIAKLGESGATCTVPALVQACRHRDTRVREGAARALGAFDDLRTLRPLAALIQDPEDGVRRAAVSSLSSKPSESVLRLLGIALWDESHEVREEAGRILAGFGSSAAEARAAANTPRSEPGAYSKWEDSHTWNEKLIGKDPDQLLAAVSDEAIALRAAAAKRLHKSQGPNMIAALVHSLGDPCDEVRRNAAESLGRRGKTPVPEYALRALRAALQDLDKFVCDAAAKALGNVGTGAKVFEALLAFVDREKGWVHETAAEALRAMSVPQNLPMFMELSQSERVRHRRVAAGALGYFNDRESAKTLIEALKDEDSEVQWRAIGSLRRRKLRDAVKPLLAHMKSSPTHLLDCFDAVEAIGEGVGDASLLALDAEYDYLRFRAARRLSEVGGWRIERAIMNKVRQDDRAVAAGACEMVVRYGERGTEDTLYFSIDHALMFEDRERASDIARCLLECGNPELQDRVLRSDANKRRAERGRPSDAKWGKRK